MFHRRTAISFYANAYQFEGFGDSRECPSVYSVPGSLLLLRRAMSIAARARACLRVPVFTANSDVDPQIIGVNVLHVVHFLHLLSLVLNSPAHPTRRKKIRWGGEVLPKTLAVSVRQPLRASWEQTASEILANRLDLVSYRCWQCAVICFHDPRNAVLVDQRRQLVLCRRIVLFAGWLIGSAWRPCALQSHRPVGVIPRPVRRNALALFL